MQKQQSVMRNFAKFTTKHLHQNLFSDKAWQYRSATSLKRRLQRIYFLVYFSEFVRISFFQNTTERLLLIIAVSIVMKTECYLKKQETTDLVTYTEKVLNRKLHFLSSEIQLKKVNTVPSTVPILRKYCKNVPLRSIKVCQGFFIIVYFSQTVLSYFYHKKMFYNVVHTWHQMRYYHFFMMSKEYKNRKVLSPW